MLESLFNKVTGLKVCWCFPVNIVNFFKNSLFYRTTEKNLYTKQKIRTSGTISRIYLRFFNNLFIFGVLTSVVNFSSTVLKRFLIFVWKFYKNIMKFFKKDYLTSWQVHEPNNNQDNIHFSVQFFLYVDNSQVLTIILKKLDF